MSDVALGRDIGANVITRGAIAVAAAGVATATGRAINIAALPARAQSVRAALNLKANLDDTDTLIVDNIKLQSDSASNFAGAVTRVTAADVTLTGTAGDTDYFGDVAMDLDLTSLPESHNWIRVSARITLSDVTNTTGAVGGVFVFGGLSLAG